MYSMAMAEAESEVEYLAAMVEAEVDYPAAMAMAKAEAEVEYPVAMMDVSRVKAEVE